MSDYFGRSDAPFGGAVWEMLDNVVIGAARSRLTGRRLLDIEGPYGVELKSIPLGDKLTPSGDLSIAASVSIPVPMLQVKFSLNQRDMAAFETSGMPFDASAITQAAFTLAAAEDALIFEGSKTLGISGLLNSTGARSLKLGSWDELGAPANDLARAVTGMDEAGFTGPYTLALAPGLYNALFRLYPGGAKTELDHLNEIVGSKIIKAAGLKSGGVLLASGKQVASIVLGLDMTVAYIGPTGSGFDFAISESLVPRISVPESVCVLKK